MDWSQSGDDLFLRLDPGEEIHASIQSIADQIGFNAAALTSGIGRVRDIVIGMMDDDGIYHRTVFSEPAELVSLQGNLARAEDGIAFTHIHAVIGDDDCQSFAGHLFEATAHVVVEAHVRILSQSLMTRCPLANSEFVKLVFNN